MNIIRFILNKIKGFFGEKVSANTLFSVTIWEKEDRDPWTVFFDNREKAEDFQKTAEKMIQYAGRDLRVTIDSGTLNDTSYYYQALIEELGPEVQKYVEANAPEEPADKKNAEIEEDMAEYVVTRAVDGRYEAVVKVPRSMIPAKDAPRDVKQAFVDLLKEKAEEVYYEANFGDMHDVVGSEIVNITDEYDNFIEDGGVMYL